MAPASTSGQASMPSPASSPSSESFDIVSTYKRLLAEDPDLTMPIAAIEALVLALSHSTFSTVSETLTLISQHSRTLKAAVPNPISLSAGTDLFQRYLITTLQRPSSAFVPNAVGGTAAADASETAATDQDFQSIRTHLINNGHLFVARAKEARAKIGAFARHFVRDGCTVLTSGGSRVVGAVLSSAADASSGSVRFRVIYVLSPASATSNAREGAAIVSSLRNRGVPVATIPESAVGYAMGKVDMVIVGAEGVVENGGIISRLGTYQMGMLAKAVRKPFYVVAESHKFVRLYPLGQYDLPIAQRVVDFRVSDGGESKNGLTGSKSATETAVNSHGGISAALNGDKIDGNLPSSESSSCPAIQDLCDAVDFTPPDLISGIITESGVLTPSAVSEELIKIWF